MTQARHHPGGEFALLQAYQRAQYFSGPHFQKNRMIQLGQGLHAIGKQYRVAQVGHPVIGIHRLFGAQPVAAAIGYHGNRGRLQRDTAQIVAKWLEHGVEQVGVGCDLDRDCLGIDAVALEYLCQLLDCRVGTG